jgi:hypothetical protein
LNIRPIAAAALAAGLALVGCGGSHPAATTYHAARLTTLQACQRLRADILRNGGTPDNPALRYVASHVTDARLAHDARAVADTPASNLARGILVGALAYDCRKVSVQIPG